MPLLLDENDIRSLLTMPDLIAAMRPAMIEYSTGQIGRASCRERV